MDNPLAHYLQLPGLKKLEIGAGMVRKPGWLATDYDATGADALQHDATQPFPVPSESFDYIYTEHMVEHIPYVGAQAMFKECLRMLKPRGVLRVVTPSIGFLTRILSADRSKFEESYRNWSVSSFVPEAPRITNAFFLNNFVRAWGHKFIYDLETLLLTLDIAGFKDTVSCSFNQSEHAALRNLANDSRLPPGFLDMESMTVEASKPGP
ncbi:MAG: methyltransferase domain-containing protein [Steroidobacteraceae bacterium]